MSSSRVSLEYLKVISRGLIESSYITHWSAVEENSSMARPNYVFLELLSITRVFVGDRLSTYQVMRRSNQTRRLSIYSSNG